MILPLTALRERFPNVDLDRVVTIADGWDSDVFLIEGEWVARVARRAEVTRRLVAEIALLAELGPTLPVAVPRFEAFGTGWVAYRRIDGEPISAGAAAAPVAAFLSALHRFPAARAAALGVPAPDWRTAMTELLEDFDRRVTPLLDAPTRERAAARFDAYLREPASFGFKPSLIHADLGPEHLLCTPDGRLVGVIDWTDTRIGDPALDFAWLLHGLGEAFAADLIAAYDGLVDETFVGRAGFFHLLGPWHEVTYGLNFGLPEYVESGIEGVRARLS